MKNSAEGDILYSDLNIDAIKTDEENLKTENGKCPLVNKPTNSPLFSKEFFNHLGFLLETNLLRLIGLEKLVAYDKRLEECSQCTHNKILKSLHKKHFVSKSPEVDQVLNKVAMCGLHNGIKHKPFEDD